MNERILKEIYKRGGYDKKTSFQEFAKMMQNEKVRKELYKRDFSDRVKSFDQFEKTIRAKSKVGKRVVKVGEVDPSDFDEEGRDPFQGAVIKNKDGSTTPVKTESSESVDEENEDASLFSTDYWGQALDYVKNVWDEGVNRGNMGADFDTFLKSGADFSKIPKEERERHAELISRSRKIRKELGKETGGDNGLLVEGFEWIGHQFAEVSKSLLGNIVESFNNPEEIAETAAAAGAGAATGAGVGAASGSIANVIPIAGQLLNGITTSTGAVVGGFSSALSASAADVGAALEFSSKLEKYANENGLDPTDPEDLKKIYENPDAVDEMLGGARRKGSIEGAFEGVANLIAPGVASKVSKGVVGKAVSGTVSRTAVKRATETQVEGISGGTGAVLGTAADGDSHTFAEYANEFWQEYKVEAVVGGTTLGAQRTINRALNRNKNKAKDEVINAAIRGDKDGYEAGLKLAAEAGVITEKDVNILKERYNEANEALKKVPDDVINDKESRRELTKMVLEKQTIDEQISNLESQRKEAASNAIAREKTKKIIELKVESKKLQKKIDDTARTSIDLSRKQQETTTTEEATETQQTEEVSDEVTEIEKRKERRKERERRIFGDTEPINKRNSKAKKEEETISEEDATHLNEMAKDMAKGKARNSKKDLQIQQNFPNLLEERLNQLKENSGGVPLNTNSIQKGTVVQTRNGERTVTHVNKNVDGTPFSFDVVDNETNSTSTIQLGNIKGVVGKESSNESLSQENVAEDQVVEVDGDRVKVSSVNRNENGDVDSIETINFRGEKRTHKNQSEEADGFSNDRVTFIERTNEGRNIFNDPYEATTTGYESMTDRSQLDGERVQYLGEMGTFRWNDGVPRVEYDDGTDVLVESGASQQTNEQIGLSYDPRPQTIEDTQTDLDVSEGVPPLEPGDTVNKFGQEFEVVRPRYDSEGNIRDVLVRNQKGENKRLTSNDVLSRFEQKVNPETNTEVDIMPESEAKSETIEDVGQTMTERKQSGGLDPVEETTLELEEEKSEYDGLRESLTEIARDIVDIVRGGKTNEFSETETSFTEAIRQGVPVVDTTTPDGKPSVDSILEAVEEAVNTQGAKTQEVKEAFGENTIDELREDFKRLRELEENLSNSDQRMSEAIAKREQQKMDNFLERKYPGIKENKKKIDKRVEAANKAVPETEFVVPESPERFAQLAKERDNRKGASRDDYIEKRGFYDPSTDTVFINPYYATETTVAHEAAHAVFSKLFDQNSRDGLLIHQTIKNVLENGNQLEQSIARELNEFIQGYDNQSKSEEYFAELVGLLNKHKHKISKRRKKSIIEKINDVIKSFTGLDVFNTESTMDDVIDLVNTISQSILKGKDINETLGYDPQLTHTGKEAKFQQEGQIMNPVKSRADNIVNSANFDAQWDNSKRAYRAEIGDTSLWFREQENPATGEFTGRIEIDYLYTPPEKRGQGSALEAKKEFLAVTDALGLETYAFSRPSDGDTNMDGLIRMNKKLGYEPLTEFLPQEMVRKPKAVEDFSKRNDVKESGRHVQFQNEKDVNSTDSIYSVGITPYSGSRIPLFNRLNNIVFDENSSVEQKQDALEKIENSLKFRLDQYIGGDNYEIESQIGVWGEYEVSFNVNIDAPIEDVILVASKLGKEFSQDAVHVREFNVKENVIGEPHNSVSEDGKYYTDSFKVEFGRKITPKEFEQFLNSISYAGGSLHKNGEVAVIYNANSALDNPDKSSKIRSNFLNKIKEIKNGRQEFIAGKKRTKYEISEGASIGVWELHREGEEGSRRTYEEYADRFHKEATQETRRRINGFDDTNEWALSVLPNEVSKELKKLQDFSPDIYGDDPDAFYGGKDAQKLREVGEHYDALPLFDKDPRVLEAYSKLTKIIELQYGDLPIKVEPHGRAVLNKETGQVEFKPNFEDTAYKGSSKMIKDVSDNNRMVFYITDKQTFGDKDIDYSDHPMLEMSEFEATPIPVYDENGNIVRNEDGTMMTYSHPMLQNDIFRVVHDFVAHSSSDATFGAKGEERAWLAHVTSIIHDSRINDGDKIQAIQALTTETRGQNTWVNFINDNNIELNKLFKKRRELRRKGESINEINKQIKSNHPNGIEFADQKTAVMPLEYIKAGYPETAELDSQIDELSDGTEHETQVKFQNAETSVNTESVSPDDVETMEQAQKLVDESDIRLVGDPELESVVKSEGEVVGALYTEANNESFSFDVVTDPDFRNRGIGTSLVNDAIQQYEQNVDAFPNMEYKVNVTNPAMERILERAGFTKSENQPSSDITIYEGNENTVSQIEERKGGIKLQNESNPRKKVLDNIQRELDYHKNLNPTAESLYKEFKNKFDERGVSLQDIKRVYDGKNPYKKARDYVKDEVTKRGKLKKVLSKAGFSDEEIENTLIIYDEFVKKRSKQTGKSPDEIWEETFEDFRYAQDQNDIPKGENVLHDAKKVKKSIWDKIKEFSGFKRGRKYHESNNPEKKSTPLREDKDLESTQEGRDYLRNNEKLIKGARMIAENGKAIIYITGNADVNTPVHELAHVYEMYMSDTDRQAVLNWTGHRRWNSETSEEFARGFELFLTKNFETSNNKLKQAFNNFKNWLLDIYKGLQLTKHKLNDEMRSLYGEMFLSDIQGIENLKEARRKIRERYKKGKIKMSQDQLRIYSERYLPDPRVAFRSMSDNQLMRRVFEGGYNLEQNVKRNVMEAYEKIQEDIEGGGSGDPNLTQEEMLGIDFWLHDAETQLEEKRATLAKARKEGSSDISIEVYMEEIGQLEEDIQRASNVLMTATSITGQKLGRLSRFMSFRNYSKQRAENKIKHINDSMGEGKNLSKEQADNIRSHYKELDRLHKELRDEVRTTQENYKGNLIEVVKNMENQPFYGSMRDAISRMSDQQVDQVFEDTKSNIKDILDKSAKLEYDSKGGASLEFEIAKQIVIEAIRGNKFSSVTELANHLQQTVDSRINENMIVDALSLSKKDAKSNSSRLNENKRLIKRESKLINQLSDLVRGVTNIGKSSTMSKVTEPIEKLQKIKSKLRKALAEDANNISDDKFEEIHSLLEQLSQDYENLVLGASGEGKADGIAPNEITRDDVNRMLDTLDRIQAIRYLDRNGVTYDEKAETEVLRELADLRKSEVSGNSKLETARRKLGELENISDETKQRLEKRLDDADQMSDEQAREEAIIDAAREVRKLEVLEDRLKEINEDIDKTESLYGEQSKEGGRSLEEIDKDFRELARKYNVSDKKDESNTSIEETKIRAQIRDRRRRLQRSISKYSQSKWKRWLKETWNIPRFLILAADLSPVMYQAGLMSIKRPMRAAEFIYKAVRSGFSEAYHQKNITNIKNKYGPKYWEGIHHGLDAQFEESGRMPEELNIDTWLEKIPLFGRIPKAIKNFSERSYNAYMNEMRINEYMRMSEGINDPEAKAQLAEYVNTFTGAAKKFGGDNTSRTMNEVIKGAEVALIAPRLYASTFKSLFKMSPLGILKTLKDIKKSKKGSAERRAYQREFGNTLKILGSQSAMIGLTYILTGIFGDDDDQEQFRDIHDSQFMKAKFGQTVVTVSPFASYVRTGLRTSSIISSAIGQTEPGKTLYEMFGVKINPSDNTGYNAEDPATKVWEEFIKYRLHPGVTSLYRLGMGRDYRFQRIKPSGSVGQDILNRIVPATAPIPAQGIYNNLKEGRYGAMFPELLGDAFGINTYTVDAFSSTGVKKVMDNVDYHYRSSYPDWMTDSPLTRREFKERVQMELANKIEEWREQEVQPTKNQIKRYKEIYERKIEIQMKKEDMQ